MMRTRYVPSNIGLLIAGTVPSLFLSFMAMMTGAFAAGGPPHTLKDGASLVFMFFIELSFPVLLHHVSVVPSWLDSYVEHIRCLHVFGSRFGNFDSFWRPDFRDSAPAYRCINLSIDLLDEPRSAVVLVDSKKSGKRAATCALVESQ